MDRAGALRRAVERSNNRHLKVLQVMVTSKSRVEIRADLEQAERLGVLVIARDELEEMLQRTSTLPDPDRLYTEAEQFVLTALERHAVFREVRA